MKKIAKLLLLFAVFTFGLTACSKEKKMEHKLERGSGKWNIKKLNDKVTTSWELHGGDHLDVGSFEFKKDKTIVKTFGFSQEKTVTTGTWVNDENKITVIWSDGKTNTLFITKKDSKKGKMTLYESYTNTYFSGVGPGSWTVTTYEYTYYLERAH